jgi:class 3 adenylate cyclase
VESRGGDPRDRHPGSRTWCPCIHLGEIDRRDTDISGLAANVAARVMATAKGQILASEMAAHAAAGRGFRFSSAGTRTLKGIDGCWELYELDDA